MGLENDMLVVIPVTALLQHGEAVQRMYAGADEAVANDKGVHLEVEGCLCHQHGCAYVERVV